MSNEKPIIPSNWQQGWKPEQLAWLKKTIPQIQYAFMERDYEAFLRMYSITEKEDRQFISLGIRKAGKQKNGNNFSILFAFGFFLRYAMAKWQDEYIEHMANRACDVYEEFLDDGPWAEHADIHKDNPYIIHDDKVAERIKALDAKDKAQTFWDDLEEDEVDPLS